MRTFTTGLLLGAFALVGCDMIPKTASQPAPVAVTPDEATQTASSPDEQTLRPTDRPDAGEVEVAVNTTTSAGSASLGETVASLGLLDRSGLWVRTPLVSSQTKGRATVVATGASVDLTLLPLDGASGAGSQISIDAMQALGVSITDLVPLTLTRL